MTTKPTDLAPAVPNDPPVPATESKKAQLASSRSRARNGVGHNIMVSHGFRRSFVRIDGRELPYELSGDVEVRTGRKGEAIVMIGVLADRISVNSNKRINDNA